MAMLSKPTQGMLSQEEFHQQMSAFRQQRAELGPQQYYDALKQRTSSLRSRKKGAPRALSRGGAGRRISFGGEKRLQRTAEKKVEAELVGLFAEHEGGLQQIQAKEEGKVVSQFKAQPLDIRYKAGDPNVKIIQMGKHQRWVVDTGERFGGKSVYRSQAGEKFVGVPHISDEYGFGGGQLWGDKIVNGRIVRYGHDKWQSTQKDVGAYSPSSRVDVVVEPWRYSKKYVPKTQTGGYVAKVLAAGKGVRRAKIVAKEYGVDKDKIYQYDPLKSRDPSVRARQDVLERGFASPTVSEMISRPSLLQTTPKERLPVIDTSWIVYGKTGKVYTKAGVLPYETGIPSFQARTGFTEEEAAKGALSLKVGGGQYGPAEIVNAFVTGKPGETLGESAIRVREETVTQKKFVPIKTTSVPLSILSLSPTVTKSDLFPALDFEVPVVYGVATTPQYSMMGGVEGKEKIMTKKQAKDQKKISKVSKLGGWFTELVKPGEKTRIDIGPGVITGVGLLDGVRSGEPEKQDTKFQRELDALGVEYQKKYDALGDKISDEVGKEVYGKYEKTGISLEKFEEVEGKLEAEYNRKFDQRFESEKKKIDVQYDNSPLMKKFEGVSELREKIQANQEWIRKNTKYGAGFYGTGVGDFSKVTGELYEFGFGTTYKQIRADIPFVPSVVKEKLGLTQSKEWKQKSIQMQKDVELYYSLMGEKPPKPVFIGKATTKDVLEVVDYAKKGIPVTFSPVIKEPPRLKPGRISEWRGGLERRVAPKKRITTKIGETALSMFTGFGSMKEASSVFEGPIMFVPEVYQRGKDITTLGRIIGAGPPSMYRPEQKEIYQQYLKEKKGELKSAARTVGGVGALYVGFWPVAAYALAGQTEFTKGLAMEVGKGFRLCGGEIGHITQKGIEAVSRKKFRPRVGIEYGRVVGEFTQMYVSPASYAAGMKQFSPILFMMGGAWKIGESALKRGGVRVLSKIDDLFIKGSPTKGLIARGVAKGTAKAYSVGLPALFISSEVGAYALTPPPQREEKLEEIRSKLGSLVMGASTAGTLLKGYDIFTGGRMGQLESKWSKGIFGKQDLGYNLRYGFTKKALGKAFMEERGIKKFVGDWFTAEAKSIRAKAALKGGTLESLMIKGKPVVEKISPRQAFTKTRGEEVRVAKGAVTKTIEISLKEKLIRAAPQRELFFKTTKDFAEAGIRGRKGISDRLIKGKYSKTMEQLFVRTPEIGIRKTTPKGKTLTYQQVPLAKGYKDLQLQHLDTLMMQTKAVGLPRTKKALGFPVRGEPITIGKYLPLYKPVGKPTPIRKGKLFVGRTKYVWTEKGLGQVKEFMTSLGIKQQYLKDFRPLVQQRSAKEVFYDKIKLNLDNSKLPKRWKTKKVAKALAEVTEKYYQITGHRLFGSTVQELYMTKPVAKKVGIRTRDFDTSGDSKIARAVLNRLISQSTVLKKAGVKVHFREDADALNTRIGKTFEKGIDYISVHPKAELEVNVARSQYSLRKQLFPYYRYTQTRSGVKIIKPELGLATKEQRILKDRPKDLLRIQQQMKADFLTRLGNAKTRAQYEKIMAKQELLYKQQAPADVFYQKYYKKYMDIWSYPKAEKTELLAALKPTTAQQQAIGSVKVLNEIAQIKVPSTTLKRTQALGVRTRAKVEFGRDLLVSLGKGIKTTKMIRSKKAQVMAKTVSKATKYPLAISTARVLPVTKYHKTKWDSGLYGGGMTKFYPLTAKYKAYKTTSKYMPYVEPKYFKYAKGYDYVRPYTKPYMPGYPKKYASYTPPYTPPYVPYVKPYTPYSSGYGYGPYASYTSYPTTPTTTIPVKPAFLFGGGRQRPLKKGFGYGIKTFGILELHKEFNKKRVKPLISDFNFIAKKSISLTLLGKSRNMWRAKDNEGL